MRLLYLTAHLSDADLAQRALARRSPPVQVEACASVRDVLAQIATDPAPAAVLVDTAPPTHDPLGVLTEIRTAHPDAVLIALVRPGTDALAGEALVAGADDTLTKHKEFYTHVPELVERVRTRRPASAEQRAGPHVLLVAEGDDRLTAALADLRVTLADDTWWSSPAEHTLAARPDVLVVSDASGATRVASATKLLRDGTVTTPVVVVTEDSTATAALYERIGVAAVVAGADLGRVPDVVRAVAETSKLAAQVAVLRAKELRLRAIVESVPASVVLIAADGTVLAMNVASLAVVGARGVGDIVGRSVFTLCDPASVADLKAFVTRVCQGTAGLARFPGRGVDGAARTFEIRAVPMPRELDTTVLLGVMRLAPPAGAANGTPSATPANDTVQAELDALRSTLSADRALLAELRDQLTAAGERESVHEAAWGAIQAELQRKLILQASLPDRQEEHERTRSLLEQTLRERDQQLLSLGEALESADAGRRLLEAEVARLRSAAAVRDAERGAELAALQESLAVARARGDETQRALGTREEELAAALAREQQLRQALDYQVADTAALRAAAEQQAREHAALVDVRQQVARLQAAAATAEQQQRALDEANDQIQRLRAALEEALGTQTDLERSLRDREAERDRATAAVHQLEAALASAAERERQLAEAAAGTPHAEDLLRDLEALRLDAEAARAEARAARAEAAELLSRALAAESQTSTVQALHEQVEEWRARHEGVQVELDALLGELAEARRQGEHSQHLAGELSSLRAALERASLDAERERAHAQASAAALEARSRDLEAAIAARETAQRELAEAVARVAQLAAAHDESAAAIGQIRGELAARERALETMQAALAAREEELRQLHVARERDAAALAQIGEQLAAARQDLAALQLARNEAQAALAAEREARGTREALDATAAAARDEALALLASREEDVRQLQEARNAAIAEIDALRRTVATLEQERTSQARLVDELRERLEALEADIVGRRAALEAAAETERAVRAAAAAAEASREDAERQLASARESQRAILADELSLRSQIADLQAQLVHERQVAVEIDADRAALRERLGRADASTQLLASRQREAQELLERTIADLRARLGEVEAAAASDRASLERALAVRESALRRLAHSGVVGMATTTADGALLRCNEALAVFCGYTSADDLLQRAGASGLPLVADWPGFVALLAASGAPVTVESCLQRPDGGVSWLHASALAIEGATGTPQIEWTVVDATDRYLRLRQQRQARRLEAVRDLAVSAGGELLEALASAPGEAAGGLVEAPPGRLADARQRVREIAQQLVAFAQKQARPAHMVDLAEQVGHLRLTLARLVGDDVSLELATGGRPLVVTADPAELDQWITSLAVVVRDALPAVGSLTVSVAARDLVLAAPPDAARVAPVASLTLRAAGYGVRAVTLPASILDAVAQRGGVARASHDAIGAATVVEIHLPLVAGLAGAEAPFPLLVRREA